MIMFTFTEDCLIHIDQIDEEHRRLFELINQSIAMLNETQDAALIAGSLLHNLKDYANTHFAHEEAYMESIRDPELPLQKTEHALFTRKVNEFVLDSSSPENAKSSLNELLTYVVRWLYRHILCSDMMIGKMPATEESSDPFAFTSKYMTGIGLIDEEHRHLFDIIRETNDLIHAEFLHDKYDEIMRLLTELKDYTEFHFSDEEALMERMQYPELEAQKRAHSAFVEKLVEIDLHDLDEMDDNQQDYLLDLIRFLLNWLTNHILGCDCRIGEYAREHNLSV